MKLKKIIGLSLILYFGAMGTILLVGLWILPAQQINGLSLAPVGSAAEIAATSSATPQPSTISDPVSSNAASSPSPSISSKPSVGGRTQTPTAPGKPPAATATPKNVPGPTPAPIKSSTPVPTPIPSPAPTPAGPACGTAGGKCTAAQVAGHNTQTNCWVMYSGNYYIVTSYVSQHPGGRAAFTSSTCGHDVTAYLSGSQTVSGLSTHQHSNSAYNILASYKVGPVSG